MERNGIFKAASSFNKLWDKRVLSKWTKTGIYYRNNGGICSRNNLPKTIKDGAYVINLNEYADAGTHWIALFCNSREIVYFHSLGVEHVPEEIK